MKFHQLVRSGIIVSILYGFAAVAGYLARLMLSRYVPLESFGLFYAVLTFVLAFSIICDMNFGQAVQVYVPELRKKRQWGKIKGYLLAVLGWQLITRVLVIGFLIALSQIFATHYFRNPLATPLIYLFAFAFLLSGFGSFTAGLVGFHRFASVAFLNLFRVLVFLGGLYAVFWFRQDVIVAGAAYVLSVLATDALTFILFLKRAMPRFFSVKAVLDRGMLKALFGFGVMLTLSSLAMQAIGAADTLTITYFRPLSELGLYQMALPTATLITFLVAWPVGLMIPATLAHLRKKQQRVIIENGRKLLVLAVVPIVAFFAVFATNILGVLFNQESALAGWMLRLLAFNQAVFLLVQFSTSTLTGLKRAKELLRISVIVTIVVIVLSVLGTKLFGSLGTIVGYFVSFCVFLALARTAIQKACGARTQFRFIIQAIVAGLATAGLMWGVSQFVTNSVLRIVLGGVAGMLAYTCIVFWGKLLDWSFVKKILAR